MPTKAERTETAQIPFQTIIVAHQPIFGEKRLACQIGLSRPALV
jgi:hypothetical protein